MKRKWFLVILFLLFACVFLFAGWKLTEELLEYRAGEQSYAALESYVSIPAPPPSAAPLPAQTPAAAAEPEEAEEAEADPTVWPVVDFEALQEVNPDIVAWLYLEGTVLNYPVVQGEDNDHYLYYMFDGSWNGIGCIFLDSRNSGDFTDRNSVIYGHHMQNGSMFACLDGYKKQEFYDAHPTILLLTPEKNYRLELFSA